MLTLRNIGIAIAAVSFALSSAAFAQHEHGDVIVGQTSGGQLSAEADEEDVTLLEIVSGPFLFGWAGDDPGFEHLEEDEPKEDFFMLPAGVDVRLECVSLTPGLKVWGPGLATLMDEPGDQLVLGDEELHTHVTWHIDTQDPNYSSGTTVWQATVRLVDAGSPNPSASEPFVLTFSHAQAVPAVSDWGVAVLILAMLIAGTVVFRKRAGECAASTAAEVGAILILGLGGNGDARAQHADDIWVGQSLGRVALHPSGMDPGSEYVELIRATKVFLGWSNNEPGFDAADSVAGGVAPLPHGASIYLRVLALDPALYVIDGGSNVLADPGDATLLGGHDLHAHPTYFVDELDPGFDPNQCAWEGIFVLDDMGSGLADSAPFSLIFSIVPFRHTEDGPAEGDYDGDQFVGSSDQSSIAFCIGGPDRRPASYGTSQDVCEVDCHNAFDFDDDLDVDLEDFAEFQLLVRP